MAVDLATSVLVLDDQPMMVDLIMNMLRALGFEDIQWAEDPLAALEMLRAKSYGLAISDIQMEPVGGLHFLRMVRSDASLQGLRVLMTTASSKPANVIAAKKAGANGYLLKPFTSQQLAAKLREILGSRM